MFALAVALSVVVGVSLGLLGGGGSILTVPILVYVAGLAPKPAIATSLFVVGVTSVAALVPHVRTGRVRWRTGLLFGFAGMTGAYTGGRLAEFVPGTLLLIAFGSMMLATAIAMLRSRRDTPGTPEPHELSVARAVSYGAAVGLVTGLVGAGGGFVIVPALALLGGLPMPAAVGTSLLVIAMNSFAGLYGHLHSVHIHWGLALGVTAAAVGAACSAVCSSGASRRTLCVRRSDGSSSRCPASCTASCSPSPRGTSLSERRSAGRFYLPPQLSPLRASGAPADANPLAFRRLDLDPAHL